MSYDNIVRKICLWNGSQGCTNVNITWCAFVLFIF